MHEITFMKTNASQNVSQKVNKPKCKRKNQKQQILKKQKHIEAKLSEMGISIVPHLNDMPGLSPLGMLYNL